MTVTIHPAAWSTYEVQGSTLTEVAQNIAAMSEAGQTHWNATYSVSAWNGNHIGTADVDVTITVSMPHWSGSSARPQAEQTEWERFVGALHTHEQGHIDLATQYLQHADTLLQGHDEHTAATNWHNNLTALQQASDTYDAGNDHGRNAGTTITAPASAATESESAEGESEQTAY